MFKYNRLCFGIAAAPAIFQRVMDQLLKGLPMVCGYLDDILVSGKTKEDNDDNVRAVLKRLDETGIRVNEEKCRCIINDVGLQPITEKVDAIQKITTTKRCNTIKSVFRYDKLLWTIFKESFDDSRPPTCSIKEGTEMELVT